MAIKEQVTLEPLCKENATITDIMMNEFIDRLQRAKANNQTLPPWDTLIPKQIYKTINVKLFGAGKSQLNEGSFTENITNLRSLYTKEGEKKSSQSPEEAISQYINDLIRFFKEFKYPITEDATDKYMSYVQKTLTQYAMPWVIDYEILDEEQSRPFVEAIFKFYREKQVNFKFFGILNAYLSGNTECISEWEKVWYIGNKQCTVQNN